jgi:uncharacterized membrane protein
MSATTFPAPFRIPLQPSGLRFGRESTLVGADDPAAGQWSVEWVLKRNCSLAPRHLLWFYVSLCAVSLGIGAVFWAQGARMILPFAWLELVAFGVALLVYARHATDNERIALAGDRLTVEQALGSRVRRVAFQPRWVRVEPQHGDRSLIELSGQGERIAVGRFVRPELRRQLAEEMRWALHRWQQRNVREAS